MQAMVQSLVSSMLYTLSTLYFRIRTHDLRELGIRVPQAWQGGRVAGGQGGRGAGWQGGRL